nr:uncharacterized protein LOC129485260 [Symphalangus syndactylus]
MGISGRAAQIAQGASKASEQRPLSAAKAWRPADRRTPGHTRRLGAQAQGPHDLGCRDRGLHSGAHRILRPDQAGGLLPSPRKPGPGDGGARCASGPTLCSWPDLCKASTLERSFTCREGREDGWEEASPRPRGTHFELHRANKGSQKFSRLPALSLVPVPAGSLRAGPFRSALESSPDPATLSEEEVRLLLAALVEDYVQMKASELEQEQETESSRVLGLSKELQWDRECYGLNFVPLKKTQATPSAGLSQDHICIYSMCPFRCDETLL